MSKNIFKLEYRPALDGLRVLCIALTLFNHIENVPWFINGSVGVDVFFSLSGFLITKILLDSDWRDLEGYYIRRFFRIIPVYYLSFFLTALLALIAHQLSVGESKLEQLYEIIIPSLLFSREFATNAPTLFGHAWTVGMEEKFYIIWPVIFLSLAVNNKRIVFLVVFLVFLFVANGSSSLRGYGGIALGSISAILFNTYRFYINTLMAAAGFVLAYAFCLHSDLWFENLAVSIAAAFLIPSIYASESHLSRFLSLPIMVVLGKMTFSIYMLHVLVFFFVKFVLKNFGIDHWLIVFIVGYTATVIFAWVVFKFFEDPLVKFGKHLASQRVRQKLIG